MSKSEEILRRVVALTPELNETFAGALRRTADQVEDNPDFRVAGFLIGFVSVEGNVAVEVPKSPMMHQAALLYAVQEAGRQRIAEVSIGVEGSREDGDFGIAQALAEARRAAVDEAEAEVLTGLVAQLRRSSG